MLTLIVSDDSAAAESLSAALSRADGEIAFIEAASVDDAVLAVTNCDREPDLVIVILRPDIKRAVGVLPKLKTVCRSFLVAAGPSDDPKLILSAVHAGADDYLDNSDSTAPDFGSLLNRLKAETLYRDEPGKIITVTSASGGAGCSILAANLSVLLAEQHQQCGLCDLDLWKGNLALMLNLFPRHTITDLCHSAEKLDTEMFAAATLKHESGVQLVAAPDAISDIETINSDGVIQVVELARKSFPFVVVDLEDFFHREQLRVLQLSDLVFVVLRLDFSALRNTRRALEYLGQAGIERDRIRLVASQQGRSRELSPSQVEEALSLKIAHYIPDDPKTALQTINLGRPAVIEAPKSKLARAVRKIAVSATEAVDGLPTNLDEAPRGASSVPSAQ
ncbi:MAG: CpaE family protein [Planctomycetaceae bacterium]